MRRSGLLLLARLLFLLLFVLSVPVLGLLLLYTDSFESWRRARADTLLGEAIGLDTTISGPIKIGFGLEPDVTISDIAGVRSDLASTVKSMSAKGVKFNLSLAQILLGRADLKSLAVDILKVDIDVPRDAGKDAASQGVDLSRFIHEFVRLSFARDMNVDGFELNYVNDETGFVIRYDFDRIGARPGPNGETLVAAAGHINGEPLTIDGKIEP